MVETCSGRTCKSIWLGKDFYIHLISSNIHSEKVTQTPVKCMVGSWKINSPLRWSIFRGNVSFRQCKPIYRFPQLKSLPHFFLGIQPAYNWGGRCVCMTKKFRKPYWIGHVFFEGGGDIMLAFEGLGGQSLV